MRNRLKRFLVGAIMVQPAKLAASNADAGQFADRDPPQLDPYAVGAEEGQALQGKGMEGFHVR